MKTVTIKEEFEIPGTDVILEAGDRFQILEAKVFSTNDNLFASAIAEAIYQTASQSTRFNLTSDMNTYRILNFETKHTGNIFLPSYSVIYRVQMTFDGGITFDGELTVTTYSRRGESERIASVSGDVTGGISLGRINVENINLDKLL